MEKYQRQVIHLYLKKEDQHQYYGSIGAIFKRYSPVDLGVAMQTLYNQWKSDKFENEKIILRRGKLITTKN